MSVVKYAGSYLDSLLVLHYLSLLLMELRHRQHIYLIRVVRYVLQYLNRVVKYVLQESRLSEKQWSMLQSPEELSMVKKK